MIVYVVYCNAVLEKFLVIRKIPVPMKYNGVKHNSIMQKTVQ